MSQPELLKRLIAALEHAGIEYMLTGSVVSSAYGAPRMTHDIDVVVAIHPQQVSEITKFFSEQSYSFDEIAAADAIARKDQFQLLEFASGDKIDFWVLSEEEFHRETFSRKCRVSIAGIETWCATPEDLIVQKLSWAQWYESDKQFADALDVYETNARHLDMSHIQRWVKAIKIDDIWQKLLREAQPFT